jgi:uncharacterized protein (DUF433 family)
MARSACDNQHTMAKLELDYRARITTDPNVMVGKPVVRGTRVPVERVLQHLADNPDVNDLFAAFPHLTIEDVQACLAYAQHVIEQRGHRAARRVLRSGARPDAATV